MLEVNAFSYTKIFEKKLIDFAWEQDIRLSNTEIRILTCINSFKNTKTGWCFPSLPTLANALNLCKDYVCRCIKKLVEKGVLLVKNRFKKNGFRSSNQYFFTFEQKLETYVKQQELKLQNLKKDVVNCHDKMKKAVKEKFKLEENPVFFEYALKELKELKQLIPADKLKISLDLFKKHPSNSYRRMTSSGWQRRLKNWLNVALERLKNSQQIKEEIVFPSREELVKLSQQEQLIASCEIWLRAKEKLFDMTKIETFVSWLNHLTFLECKNNKVTLCAPTKFMVGWIEREHLEHIKSALENKYEVEIIKSLKGE